MQTFRSLSPEQRQALEATFVCLSAVNALLEEIQSQLEGDHRTISDHIGDLTRLARHKLIAGFPEIHEWLREWERP